MSKEGFCPGGFCLRGFVQGDFVLEPLHMRAVFLPLSFQLEVRLLQCRDQCSVSQNKRGRRYALPQAMRNISTVPENLEIFHFS